MLVARETVRVGGARGAVELEVNRAATSGTIRLGARGLGADAVTLSGDGWRTERGAQVADLSGEVGRGVRASLELTLAADGRCARGPLRLTVGGVSGSAQVTLCDDAPAPVEGEGWWDKAAEWVKDNPIKTAAGLVVGALVARRVM